MTKYHVRVHYRTGNKVHRKVSWFTNIKADSDTDAGNKAIQRVVNRKTNTGAVEVEGVDARRVETERERAAKAERAKIAKWLREESGCMPWVADMIEAGEHLK